MDWITPISTLLGAVVGVGSTLLGENVRSKRDRGQQQYELRRQLYARYLEALTNTDSELQLLAIREQTPLDEADLRAAWRNHSLLSLNYEIALVGPPPVADAADTAYRSLRSMRNVLGRAEVTLGSPSAPRDNSPGTAEWQEAHRTYIDAMAALRSAMRTDITNGQRG